MRLCNTSHARFYVQAPSMYDVTEILRLPFSLNAFLVVAPTFFPHTREELPQDQMLYNVPHNNFLFQDIEKPWGIFALNATLTS